MMQQLDSMDTEMPVDLQTRDMCNEEFDSRWQIIKTSPHSSPGTFSFGLDSSDDEVYFKN